MTKRPLPPKPHEFGGRKIPPRPEPGYIIIGDDGIWWDAAPIVSGAVCLMAIIAALIWRMV